MKVLYCGATSSIMCVSYSNNYLACCTNGKVLVYNITTADGGVHVKLAKSYNANKQRYKNQYAT